MHPGPGGAPQLRGAGLRRAESLACRGRGLKVWTPDSLRDLDPQQKLQFQLLIGILGNRN